MKKSLLLVPTVLIATSSAVVLLTALPSSAARNAKSVAAPQASKAQGVRSQSVLSGATAEKLAAESVKACAKKGFAVTATVVDPDGVEIVVIRGDGSTGATVPVAKGKAAAAAGFKSPTSGLQAGIAASPGLVTVPGFVLLPGGEPIFSHNALVAGLGVSGAPSGDIDDSCAKAGLATIAAAI
jgi:uncharacterized protein GlcG (DUF336 family)